jgi:hypothetical protein
VIALPGVAVEERLAVGELVDAQRVVQPDDAPIERRKVRDLLGQVLATHHVDEIVVGAVRHDVRNRRRREGHEVAFVQRVFLAIDDRRCLVTPRQFNSCNSRRKHSLLRVAPAGVQG